MEKFLILLIIFFLVIIFLTVGLPYLIDKFKK